MVDSAMQEAAQNLQSSEAYQILEDLQTDGKVKPD